MVRGTQGLGRHVILKPAYYNVFLCPKSISMFAWIFISGMEKPLKQHLAHFTINSLTARLMTLRQSEAGVIAGF